MKQEIYIDHINLSVDSFAGSADWYKRVFGFEVVETGIYQGRPWGVLKSANALLCIYEEAKEKVPDDDIPSRYHRIYHFGLRIHNRLEWEETLQKEKIETHFESPIRYPFSTSWYVKDPSGHQIELSNWDNNEVRFP